MPGISNLQTVQAGLAHHKAGRLREAEAVYRQILAQQPDHPDALHLLGMLAQQVGRLPEAAELVRRAIAARPNEAVFHSNLSLVLMAQNQFEPAIASCNRAVTLNRKYVDVWHNLGNALAGADRLKESINAFKTTLALQPDHADAQFNLGRVLCKTGPLPEAIEACQRAVDLRPDRYEGYINLGVALYKAARYPEAMAAYRKAIELAPNHPKPHHQLSGVHWYLGQLDEAEASCRKALSLDPNYADCCATLGNILKDQGNVDEAIAMYRRSVELAPKAYPSYGSLLYTLHIHPGYDSRAIYEEHRIWNAAQAKPLEREIRPHLNDRSPDRKLRIGYVSPHFRNQATSFFTKPLLASHHRAHFEIFCYSDVTRPDDITALLQKYADTWRNIVGMPDVAVADMIRQDRIDILVDLTMHMAEARPFLFARKPAPVQVAWLAYPGTTGLSTMDYRFTDPYLDPPGVNDAFYSEVSYRLPNTVLCYDPMTTEPAVNPLPALTAGHITFGSLNHFAKANDLVLEMWAGALAAVPNSRMLVLAGRGRHRQRLERAVAAAGVDPARIEFLDRQQRPQYLEFYHRIDIVLDSFPYNGETTSLDGMWMGVPMVTLCGTTAPSRAGLCYYTNLGLTDLVAHSPQEYVQIAARLAGDLPHLAELRAGLRSRLANSQLMDAPRFARHVEAAYRSMWHKMSASSST